MIMNNVSFCSEFKNAGTFKNNPRYVNRDDVTAIKTRNMDKKTEIVLKNTYEGNIIIVDQNINEVAKNLDIKV